MLRPEEKGGGFFSPPRCLVGAALVGHALDPGLRESKRHAPGIGDWRLGFQPAQAMTANRINRADGIGGLD